MVAVVSGTKSERCRVREQLGTILVASFGFRFHFQIIFSMSSFSFCHPNQVQSQESSLLTTFSSTFMLAKSRLSNHRL